MNCIHFDKNAFTAPNVWSIKNNDEEWCKHCLNIHFKAHYLGNSFEIIWKYLINRLQPFCIINFCFRAQRRIQGEDVFGKKVHVSKPCVVSDSLFKSYTGLCLLIVL